MDPRPTPISKTHSPARERWYLCVQGRTLGPLGTEEIKFGLTTGEFLPGDKITDSRNPSWLLISEHPTFSSFVSKENGMRSALLVAPPPPQLLRVKNQPLPMTIPISIPEPPATPSIPKKFTNPFPEKIADSLPINLRDLPDAPIQKIEAQHVEEDSETNAALTQATREIEFFLKDFKESAPPSSPNPQRPSYEPIFIGKPEPARERKKNTEKRVIEIRLKLPEKPLPWLAMLAAISLAAFLFFGNGNKTRDLKDFRPPDPSSPANTPLEANDPVSPLKSPTRPQRE